MAQAFDIDTLQSLLLPQMCHFVKDNRENARLDFEQTSVGHSPQIVCLFFPPPCVGVII